MRCHPYFLRFVLPNLLPITIFITYNLVLKGTNREAGYKLCNYFICERKIYRKLFAMKSIWFTANTSYFFNKNVAAHHLDEQRLLEVLARFERANKGFAATPLVVQKSSVFNGFRVFILRFITYLLPNSKHIFKRLYSGMLLLFNIKEVDVDVLCSPYVFVPHEFTDGFNRNLILKEQTGKRMP